MPQEKTAQKSGARSRLINRKSIYMDRSSDRKSVRLRFKTLKPISCELIFYSQSDGGAPTRAKPGKQECTSDPKDNNSYEENLTKLSENHLYFVVIRAWESNNKKDKPETVTVKESKENVLAPETFEDNESVENEQPNSISPQTSNSINPVPIEKTISELFFARLNIPLRIAEVHKHKLIKAMSLNQIKNELSAGQYGCREGVPEAKNFVFREAEQSISIEGLTTQDFAAATAQPHSSAVGRLQLLYNGLNDGLDKWTLLYKLAGKDFNIPVRPISRILSLDIESDEINTIESAQLAEAVEPLKINPSKPLKFKWTTSANLSDLTNLTIQISRAEDPKAIYCVFPAAQRSAVIDPKFLNQLDDGRHVVLAQISSNQIWFEYNWVVSTYDWRSARIEK